MQRRQVTSPMAEGDAGIVGHRQDQFGVAQVVQALLAAPLEHVLGQRQVAAPGRDRRNQFASALPTQVTHRDSGHFGELLDHQRVGRDAAAETLPGLGVGQRIHFAPTAFAEGAQPVQHADSEAKPAIVGRRQNSRRTAASEKRVSRRSSMSRAQASRWRRSSAARWVRPSARAVSSPSGKRMPTPPPLRGRRHRRWRSAVRRRPWPPAGPCRTARGRNSGRRRRTP